MGNYVTEALLLYASYSDIYQPQDQYDITGAYLDPSNRSPYRPGAPGGMARTRAVVGMKAKNAKRECHDEGFEHRQQGRFAEPLAAGWTAACATTGRRCLY